MNFFEQSPMRQPKLHRHRCICSLCKCSPRSTFLMRHVMIDCPSLKCMPSLGFTDISDFISMELPQTMGTS